MNVFAFSTPDRPDWRWRIVNYAGDIVEESRDSFFTISAAVAKGTERLAQLDRVARSDLSRSPRTVSGSRDH